MDDFVRSKLNEWGFKKLIPKFEEQEIDQESLYCLDDDDIDANLISKLGPRSKFKKRLKSLKEAQIPTNQEPTELPGQDEPSTGDTSNMRKRKTDFQGESSEELLPNKKQCETGSYREKKILSEVKRIMASVNDRLPEEENEFIKFLKTQIKHLKIDKRELVGVFGKTGAGKSSLINAVIGKKLLPSGDVKACTSVMIKVEANTKQEYEAEIEFITKEEWKEELEFFLGGNKQNVDLDGKEKLTALYGDQWKDKSPETLMDVKYFEEITEFIDSDRKNLKYESASELSAALVQYTRTASKVGASKGVNKWYWPLVKCVTIRVPDNDLLQHVTLVDLPGNGDCNKSRDKMWKEEVGNCSTVWIVTETNRAASEPEPWEILENAASRMGNGGQCQKIYFICTKTDLIDSDDCSEADMGARIFARNKEVKEEVSTRLITQPMLMKHFSEKCFEVFTVSAKEFKDKKYLTEDETEIPRLQGVLEELNNCHSETLNYVSGARGILSLIQVARGKKEDGKLTDVYRKLQENLQHNAVKVKKEITKTAKSFEVCLTEGVKRSKDTCENLLHTLIHPDEVTGSAFHKVLDSVIKNQGAHKERKEMNLNATLASRLTESVDGEFMKTFPNDRTRGPFNGSINEFSLGTEKLNPQSKDIELLLIFLKTEEVKIKKILNETIRDSKKIMYNSLTTTIEETMSNCYKEAAGVRGKDSLMKRRTIIEKHVRLSKNVMFEKAKDKMLSQLKELTEEIWSLLEETLPKSIKLSLKTDESSLPDFNDKFNEVDNFYKELRSSQP